MMMNEYKKDKANANEAKKTYGKLSTLSNSVELCQLMLDETAKQNESMMENIEMLKSHLTQIEDRGEV